MDNNKPVVLDFQPCYLGGTYYYHPKRKEVWIYHDPLAFQLSRAYPNIIVKAYDGFLITQSDGLGGYYNGGIGGVLPNVPEGIGGYNVGFYGGLMKTGSQLSIKNGRVINRVPFAFPQPPPNPRHEEVDQQKADEKK